MIELGMVAALLGGLVGAAALLSRMPWDWLLVGGAILVVVGMLVSVPAGVWYHVRLYRALKAVNQVAPRWWLYPTKQHPLLGAAELRFVTRPFFAGAIGFGLAILGCVFVGYGALRSPPG
jgi:hypothetical protein